MAIRAHLIGLPNTRWEVAANLLAQFAAEQKHHMEEQESDAEAFDVIAITESSTGHTTIFLRWTLWWSFYEFLADALSVPILVFHMYEDDYWQYDLYMRQKMIDTYNVSIVFYPPEAQPSQEALQIKPHTLSQYWPNINILDIKHYFVPWREDEYNHSNTTTSRKAYEDDVYRRGDVWQLSDFMQKLGLAFPISVTRSLIGQTYMLQQL